MRIKVIDGRHERHLMSDGRGRKAGVYKGKIHDIRDTAPLKTFDCNGIFMLFHKSKTHCANVSKLGTLGTRMFVPNIFCVSLEK